MDKHFCTHEINKSLHELEFNEECFGESVEFFNNSTGVKIPEYEGCSALKSAYPAVLWSQAIEYLLDIHNLHLVPIYSYNDELKWSFHIEDLSFLEEDEKSVYLPLIDSNLSLHSNIHDARTEAILKAIEIIKNK